MSHHKTNIRLSQAIALRIVLDQPADAYCGYSIRVLKFYSHVCELPHRRESSQPGGAMTNSPRRQASVFMSYAMPNSIKTTISMIGTPINHKRIGICYPFRYGSGVQRIDTEAVPGTPS